MPPTRSSRAASCSKLCPASETKVYYGGTIDDATAENGKSYSDLPNAFRYRNEQLVTDGMAQTIVDDLKSVKIEE